MLRESITAEELASASQALKIYDIRKNPDEDQIPGSIPSDAWDLEFGGGPPFSRDEEVVLYCGSGNSCSRVADALRQRGYNAMALDGGFKAWIEADLPIEPRRF